MSAVKIPDNSSRCPWCRNFIIPNRSPAPEYVCEKCGRHYEARMPVNRKNLLDIILLFEVCMVNPVLGQLWGMVLQFDNKPEDVRCIFYRWKDTVMPERGYRVSVRMRKNVPKLWISEDMIIPVVFVNAEERPVSDLCCVRIENMKRRKDNILCDMKLLAYGKEPAAETDEFLMFNRGKPIARGKVHEKIDCCY